ncbi:hypothetical protein [Pelagibius sp. Alg239-R121]|uniref:hypothetical protein n=1 Tax=Pelagibius sp. Alg239-R121 TaxID=2993448 RepID=UPI0024A6B42C|nr:hypothetical protein [Pelagibius sp. Alg239-R121]
MFRPDFRIRLLDGWSAAQISTGSAGHPHYSGVARKVPADWFKHSSTLIKNAHCSSTQQPDDKPFEATLKSIKQNNSSAKSERATILPANLASKAINA